MIKIKRVYETPADSDGFRVLVDRLWPRGMTKEKAKVDLWLKDIAPSTELRKWFGHDPEKWPEFQTKYSLELKGKQELLDQLIEKAKKQTVTMIYGAKDEEHNEAEVLKEKINNILKKDNKK